MIQVKKISKSFGSKEQRYSIFHDLSFEVKEGSFVALLGTSGSGKTTLLKCMTGIEESDEGNIIFQGQDLCKLEKEEKKKFRREHMGLVFQNFELLPILNVRENIILPLKLSHKKVDERYFDKLVNTLGIKDKLKNKISELSGGQQQRVAIARALITKPQIIFADEPTGNLDNKNTKEVVELLLEINHDFHTTIFIVTHDLEVASVAEKIFTLEDGSITCT